MKATGTPNKNGSEKSQLSESWKVYTQSTGDGKVRQASCKGLRRNKNPKDVTIHPYFCDID